MRHPRTILEAYRRGDRLPDDELHLLHEKMKALNEAASEFGEIFHLQAVYAAKVEWDCREFMRARALKG